MGSTLAVSDQAHTEKYRAAGETFRSAATRMAGNWRVKRPLVETTYGWAITCHQSQGSQQDNAVVWDDGLGRTEAARRCWLYTAITRAEKGLVLLA